MTAAALWVGPWSCISSGWFVWWWIFLKLPQPQGGSRELWSVVIDEGCGFTKHISAEEARGEEKRVESKEGSWNARLWKSNWVRGKRDTVIKPISQMRKVMHREVKYFFGLHRWQNQNPNPAVWHGPHVLRGLTRKVGRKRRERGGGIRSVWGTVHSTDSAHNHS